MFTQNDQQFAQNTAPNITTSLAALDGLVVDITTSLAAIDSLIGVGEAAHSGLEGAILEAQTLHAQIQTQAGEATAMNLSAMSLLNTAEHLLDQAKLLIGQAMTAASDSARHSHTDKRHRGYGPSNPQIEE